MTGAKRHNPKELAMNLTNTLETAELTALDENALACVSGGNSDPNAAREAREALEEFLRNAQRYLDQQNYGF
ncbi:MAG: hypothetical protein IPG50_09855 [Myxococcales bacterium]|nr:hypothetical protein [Myxococcales bacterium]